MIGLAVLAAGALMALRVPRLAWTSVGAALMLGCAGYVVQGHPNQPEKLAVTKIDTIEIEADVADMRNAMFGNFHNGTPYLAASDALLRAGEPRAAAQAMLGAVRSQPQNAALWTELGSTIALSDGGTVSPAALFAFQRAMKLAPDHPGPHYFLGLAYLAGGRGPQARVEWIKAYRLTPEGAPYRPKLAERLVLLDQFMQMNQGAPATR